MGVRYPCEAFRFAIHRIFAAIHRIFGTMLEGALILEISLVDNESSIVHRGIRFTYLNMRPHGRIRIMQTIRHPNSIDPIRPIIVRLKGSAVFREEIYEASCYPFEWLASCRSALYSYVRKLSFALAEEPQMLSFLLPPVPAEQNKNINPERLLFMTTISL